MLNYPPTMSIKNYHLQSQSKNSCELIYQSDGVSGLMTNPAEHKHCL